ncbi:MAG: carboxypeptidase regulatory-like domain-containing protein [Pseudodesulfovibrio sp.]|nr:carboxypeptidase regulatory-like domain-containing protein [Pseudodesulfovibrio sp.]
MLRKTVFTIILVLSLVVPVLAGGTSIIYGAVDFNGVPMENALVTVIGEATYTSKSVVTDSRGIYVIEGLSADEYIVRALAKPDGTYKPGEKNIFLGKGKKKEVNFSMKKK